MRLTDGKALALDGGGLRAVVTETRHGRVARFTYRFRLSDARVEMRLGTWPDKSLAELRSLRDQAREFVRRGIDPREAAREAQAQAAREKAAKQARLTVRGLFEKWDRLHLKRAYKDQGAEPRRYFEKDILPVLGDLPAEELGRAHVARVVDAALERGAPRVAALLLSYLRQMSRWGMARGYLENDPTAALRKTSIPTNRARERVLSDEELRELARRLPKAGLPKWAPPAVWILLATATRVGELLQSRWSDVDLERGEWSIPAENAKNGRAHLVYLSPFACRLFRELLALRETEWVIAGREVARPDDDVPTTRPVDKKAMAHLLRDRQRLAKNAGRATPLGKRTIKYAQALALPGGLWTAHDLRRSAATLMQQLGVLPAVIEKCLNHTETRRMVAVYQRAEYLPERRDAFERLGQHLDSIVTSETRNEQTNQQNEPMPVSD
ncbi:MAG: site-specific integrase [Chromatiaceae bacterium]|jgi:integrase|nr:site-specific integrase [Chromatiaceae bacterium]